MRHIKLYENFDSTENLSDVPPQTLEEQIKFCMKWYPTLYDSKYGRIKVLRHLYLSIGVEYEWEDGRLVSGYLNTDKKMYEYRKRVWVAQKENLQREIESEESYFNTLKAISDRTKAGVDEQRYLEKLQNKINSLKKKLNTFDPYGEEYPNEEPLTLENIRVYDESNLFHIPSDVLSDYLEGAKEILKFILNLGYSGPHKYELIELAEELGVI